MTKENNEMIEVQQHGMLRGNPPDPCIVVIFGASGDLGGVPAGGVSYGRRLGAGTGGVLGAG